MERGNTAKKRLQRHLATASCLLLLSAQQVGAETLKEAAQFMIETHPDIRTVAHNRLARDQERVQARSLYWPKIDANAGFGIADYRKPYDSNFGAEEYTISGRLNVFNGLGSIHEVKRQEARINSAAYQLQSDAANLTLRAAEVYCDMLRHTTLLELARENLLIHERIADQIALRSESGVSSMADVDQVQARLALARANVVTAEANLEDAKSSYFAVIGKMPKDLAKPEIPPNVLPASLDEALAIAEEHHPTYQSAIADLGARKMQYEVAKSPFLPLVDVEVDKRWNNNSGYDPLWEDSLIAMVRVRYNLFQGWKDEARRQETFEQINEAREISKHTRRQVVEGLRLSWMAYQAVMDGITYQRQRVEAISRTSEAFSKQWSIGQRTLFDVLDAAAETIDAKKSLIHAEYDGLYSGFRILNSMGSIVPALDLQLPEEANPFDEDNDFASAFPETVNLE